MLLWNKSAVSYDEIEGVDVLRAIDLVDAGAGIASSTIMLGTCD
jgi:hypothetical protein